MVDRATRCEELFAVEGYAHVRRTAREGLAEDGAGPALHRWLGVAHAAEDDDEHDIEAERAFEAGLAQWPDDLGLLVSYEELCRRADGWAHPTRVRRGTELRARIAELAPPGSAARERVDAVMGLDGPGYWVDHPVGPGHPRPWERPPLGHDVALALGGGDDGAERPRHPEDLRATEVAVALELLAGPSNAPLRLLLRHRLVAYGLAFALALATNRLLVLTGAVSFSVWGWLWFLPLVPAEARLRYARGVARDRVVTAVAARHAAESADPV
ncbi:hypothetical protein ACIRP0_16665 [Streptomyces sp. NPDC101733]|uniref:hypothetical protein n=1 Tax=unclassified Streptomyces TaxID=2593676 RepID=UPI00380025A9